MPPVAHGKEVFKKASGKVKSYGGRERPYSDSDPLRGIEALQSIPVFSHEM